MAVLDAILKAVVSLATQFVQLALFLVGHAYTWGEEPWFGTATTDPYDTDCSGVVFAIFRKLGVLWKNGAAWPRLTADGYYHNSVPVAVADLRVGDIFSFVNSSGNSYHTGVVIGLQPDGHIHTVEARGHAWGVVNYSINDPVNGIIHRGGHFRRFPWVNLGAVTPPPIPTPEPQPLPNYPTLHRGDYNSKYVKILQTKLNAKGYKPKLLTDGDFGYKTLQAVEWFQKHNKDASGKPLEVDGVVGPKTWAALLK
jgi:hypothetical protein